MPRTKNSSANYAYTPLRMPEPDDLSRPRAVPGLNTYEMGKKETSVGFASKEMGTDSPASGSEEEAPRGRLTEEQFKLKTTLNDVQNMQRMGRTQQLVRHFRLFSTISFVAIATANWELTIFTMTQALVDGGRANLIWSYVWNFFGFLPIILSLAEMASMAPIAGAQYHWVSEFAPSSVQKPLSYFTGWMSTLAWQAGNAQGFFLTGTLVQTLILINDESYSFPGWQGTLLVIAAIVVGLIAATFFSGYIPHLQNLLFIGHCLLYTCVLIPVWVLADKTDARSVFLTWENNGGWSSTTLAVLAGQLSGIATMTGVDTAAHMSEEIKDASRNVPIAMIGAYMINFLLSMPIIITMVFAMPDLELALDDPTAYPAVYVLRQTMSTGWVTVLVALIVVILMFSNISYIMAVSRDLFAFARDNGVPFSKWVSHVDKKKHVPVNSIIVSCVVAALLSLINIGSSTAFYAITSLFVVAILQCYMFSIGSLLWRRLKKPESIPPARWSLGRWGIPLNIMAMIYVVWAFFWSFWPQYYPVDASTFNWASVIFGAVTIGCAVLYIWARKVYTGPVALVEGRRQSFNHWKKKNPPNRQHSAEPALPRMND